MSLGKAVKKVLWFELIWKLLILGLINPLFREIYQTYVASTGAHLQVPQGAFHYLGQGEVLSLPAEGDGVDYDAVWGMTISETIF